VARDLGERLGTGAHLRALRREAIGMLRAEQGVALNALSAEVLLPPMAVLGHLGRVEVSEEEARDLGHGRAVRRTGGQADRTSEPVAIAGPDGRLVAVGRWTGDALQPEVVLESAG
jgi:tRNA pseudouridine55 synthase